MIHLIIKIANADNNNNNKNENNNNNNDNNNNNVHEQTFVKLNKFSNNYGMMFVGAGREFPDFPEYPDIPEIVEETDVKVGNFITVNSCHQFLVFRLKQ